MKVLELFAGVGGFRIGLENADKQLFKTKWANQWEPSRKSQDAFEVYDYHFPNSENINISISDITDEQFSKNGCRYDCRWFSLPRLLSCA